MSTETAAETGSEALAKMLGMETPPSHEPRRLHVVDDPEDDITGVYRPVDLSEYIGQPRAKMQVQAFVLAAKKRGQQPKHILLSGPPGLGKTTMSKIVQTLLNDGRPANQQVKLHVLMGSTVRTEAKLAVALSKITRGDVFFLDECHRMTDMAEEMLGLAMEDGEITVPGEKGEDAIQVKIPPFTLVGATTKPASLTRPLRDRFALSIGLDYYSVPELAQIVRNAAKREGMPITDEACEAIAKVGRGTPRVALARWESVRDNAVIADVEAITAKTVADAMHVAQIDAYGLDDRDRRYLDAVAKFGGKRVGILTLSSAVGLEGREITHDIEPYLIRSGMLDVGRRGRCLTRAAYEHLRPGMPIPPVLGLG